MLKYDNSKADISLPYCMGISEPRLGEIISKSNFIFKTADLLADAIGDKEGTAFGDVMVLLAKIPETPEEAFILGMVVQQTLEESGFFDNPDNTTPTYHER